MKRVSFKPSIQLVKLLSGFTLILLFFTLVLDQTNPILELFVSASICFAVVALYDLFTSVKQCRLTVSRQLPNNLSYSHSHQLSLKVENNSNDSIRFKPSDCVPKEFEITGFSDNYQVAENQSIQLNYRLKPLKRGAFSLGPLELSITSKFKLWQTQWQDSDQVDVKVYPNFNRINQSESLKGINNLTTTGLKKLKKRGDGIEFHQLREFRQGDTIRQIDWQATSKRQKLISKEYQEEQNQHIIVMLDAGSKMNLETEIGTHFDAALNALLMLSHTVLKQGDWFSMQSFNLTERWLPAVKGAQNVSRVMNHFYDLHPDESATDYMQAVNNLLLKRSKRSLVLLVTSLNDHDISEILPAIKRLQQHHLVALINIQNVSIHQIINAEIDTESSANQYCAAIELNNLYQFNLARLAKEGVIVVDTQAEFLLPHVVNTYLNVKHSGML
ncbi:DUF58 domain-containing protein [Catenovulum maritimum]|uniref:DUF58 domain-containing protein n=1 Tax=Catenovulum maritimum TaxID=1513271 RepID=A0A0J8GW28_9ALTE|nr:DUF58 domain-containing protein [Catenovulum maritimum]KMT66980.1 hypothetical protein XM47_02495 [Catenovulum maritimum]